MQSPHVPHRTAPVEEVLTHGINGLLVDFFDAKAMADTIVESIDQGATLASIRSQARTEVIQKFSFAAGELAYRQLIDDSHRVL